ncbi:MAG: hypothetical protein AAF401_07840 [Pseudomonadota bacterium]
MGITLTLVGVEDWHGPAPKTEDQTHEDTFDFTNGAEDGETEGLLLPAVQTVSESARPSSRNNEAPADSFDFKTEEEEVGMLLPAVQAAREAARGEEEHYYTIVLENGTVAGIDDGEDLLIINNGDGSDDQGGGWTEINTMHQGQTGPETGDSADGGVTPLDALVVINEIDSVL